MMSNRNTKEQLREIGEKTLAMSRKLRNKPVALRVLPMRTLNTAILICQGLDGIPFEQLTLDVYFYCKDSKFQEFCHEYESQIELAAAAKEKFEKGLLEFYRRMCDKIIKENKQQDFFEFIGSCFELEFDAADNHNNANRVMQQYTNLLLGQLEFLRPSKFDFTHMVGGYDTRNKCALMIADPFPLLDMPAYDLCEIDMKSARESDIIKLYRKYGFLYTEYRQIEEAGHANTLFTITVGFMIPYITERSACMLPRSAISIYQEKVMSSIPSGDLDVGQLRKLLMRRRRLLKEAPVKIHCGQGAPVSSIELMESVHCGKPVLLWAYRTKENGDTCGVYIPSESKFMSFFKIADSDKGTPYTANDNIEQLILWCYAALVCSEPDVKLTLTSRHFHFEDHLSLTTEVVYRQSGASESGNRDVRAGNEKYEAVESDIGFFIRKLPDGQSASREAKEQAEEMGFALSDGETFVQSFSRTSYRLRQKKA